MTAAVKPSIEEDFAAWADETANLLEQRCFDELDIADLVEEVRGLGRSEFDSVHSQLRRLLVHVLKWEKQPQRRSRSWRISMLNARYEISRKFNSSPSLRQKLTLEVLADVWLAAREKAAIETGINEREFPEVCPWNLDTQILQRDWLP